MSFEHWQERNGKDSYERLTSLAADIFEAENDDQFSQELLEKFLNNIEQFNEDMKEYENEKKENSTFPFWKQYMEMVQILLLFIRAEREGNWKLHIDATKGMIPLWYMIMSITCVGESSTLQIWWTYMKLL